MSPEVMCTHCKTILVSTDYSRLMQEALEHHQKSLKGGSHRCRGFNIKDDNQRVVGVVSFAHGKYGMHDVNDDKLIDPFLGIFPSW